MKWKKGQLWKTQHGQTMEVVRVRRDGVALIKMTKPIKTRAHTQLPIPESWNLIK